MFIKRLTTVAMSCGSKGALVRVIRQRYSGGGQRSSSSSSFGSLSSLLYPSLMAVTGISCVLATTSDNCGIVGVAGTDTDAPPFLLEGLTILRNRGYDSAGIATVTSGKLAITKYASRDTTCDSIDLVKANAGEHKGHFTGIAHTRWATHGGKTDENAHPHTDYNNRIALVHNGTINNSYDLKKELQAQGIVFKSETDTEVIAHLVGQYLDKGHDTKEALRKVILFYFIS
jgi:glutamine phosphoribosylpyrophosphate amidotransferase